MIGSIEQVLCHYMQNNGLTRKVDHADARAANRSHIAAMTPAQIDVLMRKLLVIWMDEAATSAIMFEPTDDPSL